LNCATDVSGFFCLISYLCSSTSCTPCTWRGVQPPSSHWLQIDPSWPHQSRLLAVFFYGAILSALLSSLSVLSATANHSLHGLRNGTGTLDYVEICKGVHSKHGPDHIRRGSSRKGGIKGRALGSLKGGIKKGLGLKTTVGGRTTSLFSCVLP